ncbi:MAG TPA: hypothetical protein VE777_15785 [Gaiellales bacterium]|nr:hypothetical protein [Gaiellales bacterium]
MRAWTLGMDEAGWTDEVMDEAERLLPFPVAAGYADVDSAAGTWRFTAKAVSRAEELDSSGRR